MRFAPAACAIMAKKLTPRRLGCDSIDFVDVVKEKRDMVARFFRASHNRAASFESSSGRKLAEGHRQVISQGDDGSFLVNEFLN